MRRQRSAEHWLWLPTVLSAVSNTWSWLRCGIRSLLKPPGSISANASRRTNRKGPGQFLRDDRGRKPARSPGGLMTVRRDYGADRPSKTERWRLANEIAQIFERRGLHPRFAQAVLRPPLLGDLFHCGHPGCDTGVRFSDAEDAQLLPVRRFSFAGMSAFIRARAHQLP